MKRKKQGSGILVGMMLGIFVLLGPLDLFSPGPTWKWSSKRLLSGTGFAQGVTSDRGTSADTGTANPVPLINQPLVPDAVAPGGAGFTLTVNGTGFVSGSVVNWNGSALTTTFVSGSQLTAIVPAADIAIASTASVTVVNPSPEGGTSNVVYLPVSNVTLATFRYAPNASTGSGPTGVVVGDFNGDGIADLATANANSSSVSVLLGNGDGTFTLASSPDTKGSPGDLVVGDFNGDGKLDLAVANGSADNVAILLGNGDGTFNLASSPGVGSHANWIAAGDFNADGKLDLAVVNDATDSVSILLGNGDGTFTLVSTPGVGSNPRVVAVGDFNGDGKLDLAVANANSSTVSILLGSGDGTFTLSSSPRTGGITADGVVVGDFNGDGKLDLAVSNATSNNVGILLGNGDGTFSLTSSVGAGPGAGQQAIGDLNGDGKPDLVLNTPGDNKISILLGSGDGTVTLLSSLSVGSGPFTVAVGDFNQDGTLDLAVPNFNDYTVSILLQTTTVSLSTTSLKFPDQLIGTTSPAQTVTLTNTGALTLTISGIAVSVDFLQTNTCGSSVQPGASCTIDVSFKPTAKGTRTGTLTITDNAANSPQTVTLTGTGSVVELSPARLNFGNQKVGTTSPPQTVTVTNTGGKALNVTGVGITGTDFADFADSTTCGNSLGQGQSCIITVTFTPRATGKRHASVDVGDNGGGSPQRIALNGTGT